MFKTSVNKLIEQFNKLQAQSEEAIKERQRALNELLAQQEALTKELGIATNINKLLKTIGIGEVK